jgi:hypothetical protein
MPNREEAHVRLEIEPKAYDFLKKKGGICTIRLSMAKGCCGGMPLPEISFTAPKDETKLVAFVQDEVSVYVGKGLRFEDDIVRISLSGVLFFKSLELPTLRLLETCDRQS